jgi:hypothetical protein
MLIFFLNAAPNDSIEPEREWRRSRLELEWFQDCVRARLIQAIGVLLNVM